MAIGNDDSLACDLLILVATQTEFEQLQAVAQAKRIRFDTVDTNSSLGSTPSSQDALDAANRQAIFVGTYYTLGRIGSRRVNAVRCNGMGPFSYDGSASRAIFCRLAMGATSIVQLGMAFGVDREKQKLGDVLVSKTILPYDMRDVVTEGDRYVHRYSRVKTHRASPSLVSLFTSASRVGSFKDRYQVHIGQILSGSARIWSRHYLDELLNHVPGAGKGVIGGEMEGIGLLSVSHHHTPIWIIIKGICDFADEKRDDEIESARVTACRNSADFLLECLLKS